MYNDVAEGNRLLHGQETCVFAHAGYQDADKRADAQACATWRVAMLPGKRRAPQQRQAHTTVLKYGLFKKQDHDQHIGSYLN